MTPPVLPSVDALLSSDDSLLDHELRLAAVRRQTAVVRALLDQVERFGSASGRAPVAQMIDEMDRLTRSVEAGKAESAARPLLRSAP
jgi:hypothetical protein